MIAKARPRLCGTAPKIAPDLSAQFALASRLYSPMMHDRANLTRKLALHSAGKTQLNKIIWCPHGQVPEAPALRECGAKRTEMGIRASGRRPRLRKFFRALFNPFFGMRRFHITALWPGRQG